MHMYIPTLRQTDTQTPQNIYIIRPKLISGFKETVGFKENRQNLNEMYMAEAIGLKVNLVIFF